MKPRYRLCCCVDNEPMLYWSEKGFGWVCEKREASRMTRYRARKVKEQWSMTSGVKLERVGS